MLSSLFGDNPSNRRLGCHKLNEWIERTNSEGDRGPRAIEILGNSPLRNPTLIGSWERHVERFRLRLTNIVGFNVINFVIKIVLCLQHDFV